MTEFKVGDKVRFTAEKYTDWVGQEGIVENYDGTLVTYRITKAAPTDLGSPWNAVGGTVDNYGNQLTLIEAPVKDSGVGLSRYTAGMPDGVEPRHIMSEQKWYESFAKASILKYICRLDHKGQYLSDLKKIKTYAEELILLEESKTSE